VITAKPNPSTFRADAVRGLPTSSRVDRANRTIYGCKALELGALNEGDQRPYKVDRTSLEQLTRLVAQRNQGVKMRFAHPNMSRDGMGRHLGRASNPRIIEENGTAFVAVDAKLNAKGGPRTMDMVEHVLDMAQNAPEDFGLSIAPLLDSEAMGKIEPDENGLVPIRLKSLQAIDVVDDPAATRGGLFSLDSVDIADLPEQASVLLDTYFGTATPDVIKQRAGEFLDRYLKNRGCDMASESNDQLGVEEDVAAMKAEIAALRAEIAAMKDGESEGESEDMEGDENKKEDQAMESETEKKDEQAMAKQQAKDEMARRAEITALCKLAKVPDADRDLLIAGGLSRQEASEWIKGAGYLAAKNPPIDEESTDKAENKPSPEQAFAAEYDANAETFTRQGVTKEQYIKSRQKDAA
jgi:hypothetical protein